MATEEEKEFLEEENRRQDSEPDTEKDNQDEGSNETDRNPVELSRKRQRKELRRAEPNNAVSQAREELNKLKKKDPETVDKFAAGVAQGFRENFGGGGGTEAGQQTDGNGAVPVQGIQGGGYSTPEQAPAGNPNAGLHEQEREQLDDIRPDQFSGPDAEQPAEGTADTESAPQPGGQAPAQDPTLPQRVNEDYNAVAAGVGPTDSASVKGTEKSAVESAQKTEQENKTLASPAQEMFDKLEADKGRALQDVAAAQEKYGIQNTQDVIDGKLKEAEAKKGSPLTARERRKITREAEREQEASLDKLYKELDPNYKSSKDFRREQNIKTIIGAIGKLGTMAGQAVTAANSGIILPTRSFSDGIMEDVRISNKEREQLLRAYDEIRQAKINEPLARLQAAEKEQLDLVKSGAAYQTGKTTQADKTTYGKEKTLEKKKEKIDYKDWIEAHGGGKKERFADLKNGEFIISGRYRNGNATGGYRVPMSVMINQGEKLFGLFKGLPDDVKGEEGKEIHTMLRQLKKDMEGATDEKGKLELGKNYAFLFDEMLKRMENIDDQKIQKAIDEYEDYLKGGKFAYESWMGDAGGQQQGTFNQAAVDALMSI